MKLLYFIVVCLFLSTQINAQGEANNWYFGSNAGITFNTNPPSAVFDGQLNTLEGCSSISDTGGNLLFYTDGRTIWDKNHDIMPNADYFGGTGLHGDPSSTSSGLIVPHPTNTDIYFVFTVDEPHQDNANAYPNQGPADQIGNPIPNYQEGEQYTVPEEDDGFNNGLNYSIVDISLRNGLGDVVQGERNNPLITYDENNFSNQSYKCAEKITAVIGADCETIWLITHFINNFYAFLIDEDGVNENPVISQLAPTIGLAGYRRNALGYLKASPDAERLLMANTQTANTGTANGNVYLYDFDNATGIVSNPLQLINNIRPYGVEFSPDSKKAYATSSIGQENALIYQWDLNADDISSSIYTQPTAMLQATAIQLGPNGKIYTPQISTARLNVINNPNELGENMNYSSSTLNGAVALQGLPAYFGLPPFIQSIFTSRVDIITDVSESNDQNFIIETELNLCGSETYTLGFDYEEPATYQWFENGQALDGETSPNLEISLSATLIAPYETAYTLEIFPENGECKLSGIANVIFGEVPSLDDATLVQCVNDFDNQTAVFNLNNARADFITNTDLAVNDFEYQFFETEDDFENETPIEAISNYENTSNPQTIIAKIINTFTRCTTTVNLTLIVDDVEGTEEIDLFVCDDNLNGIQEFNLELAANETSFIPTSFYRSINNALQDVDRINNTTNFINTEPYLQTIYFRTSEGDGCGILGILDLRVNNLPFEFDDQQVFYCVEDSPNPIQIAPSVPENIINNYEYFWPATNQETFAINVNETGTYQVLVTEIATGCSSLQNIIVSNSGLPSFNVLVDDGDEEANSLFIEINENDSLGDYEFAIENPSGPYSDNSLYEDLPPGFYDVFIRDKNGCGIAKRTVGLIGLRQFFTPNNDGINDTWNVAGLSANRNAIVRIFDRFGKLLIQFTAQNRPGWDGTYNGKLMPNNDYWYAVEVDDGRVLTGNFTLKR